jgi:hypothetical protein
MSARRVPERRQQVRPPAAPSLSALADTSGIVATLFTIEPVALSVVFDASPEVVRLDCPRSSALFDLLNRANLERGTVIEMSIRGNPIAPAALARLNWFLHVHGYTRGFRGWKRARRSVDGGLTLWRSAPAWLDLKTLLRL